MVFFKALAIGMHKTVTLHFRIILSYGIFKHANLYFKALSFAL